MPKKQRNIEKVAAILKCEVNRFDDGSATWLTFENHDYLIEMSFDGKGEVFENIIVIEKIREVVDHKLITRI